MTLFTRFRWFRERDLRRLIFRRLPYCMDEPENSLSPKLQLELVKFLQDSARYFNCQLIIATHSPFILSIAGAKIYDLDQTPVDIRNWTELENVRAYYDFFKKHDGEFELLD